MNIEERINVLSKLGKILEIKSNSLDFEKIYQHNPWFTHFFLEFALKQWCNSLSEDKLHSWINKYGFQTSDKNKKTIGIIAAGNIPLVGFHDVICSYISGNNTIIKLSSKDNILMKYVIDLIKNLDNNCGINYCEERLSNFDAIIASGSQNSNLYFNYYFSKYPHIFRNNRTSIAVISDKNSTNDLESLADDVFIYFGFGCRNVSKIFIPKDFNFDNLGIAFQKYDHLANHYKYYNNLCYQYAILSMNQIIHANFGNLLLTENKNIFSPISVLHYEYYSDIAEIENNISENKNSIQCIVSNNNDIKNTIKFGNAQKPELYDFADNIDTIQFLLNI